MARVLDAGNPFSKKEPASDAPVDVNVTPSDTVDLAKAPQGLYAATAGNIVVLDKNGVSKTYAILAAQTLKMDVKRVMATNTTATGIKAVY